MTISSSLNAGVSGLTANSNKLATISDNIANSQTFGYKTAGTDFASVAIGENVGNYVAGGVKSASLRNVDAKGALIGSANATDLTISGRGMLPVTGIAQVQAGAADLPLMLTSTGSFDLDKNGVLRSASGLVLLGWPADANGNVAEPPRDSGAALRPVTVDRSAIAAVMTSEITLKANLPASASLPAADPTATYPMSVEYFDPLGASQTLDFTFTPVGAGDPATTNQWTLTITDNATGTVQGEFEIGFSGVPGTGGKIDTLTSTGGTATYDGTSGAISMTLDSGQVIDVNIGATGAVDPQYLTQFDSGFTSSGATKDGSGAGVFTGVAIDENGFLSATYSSGFTQVIYQIPVADVPNMNGLTSLSNQAFQVSNASGGLYLWNAGDGPTGAVLGFTREQSTTDVAQELTQLIQTQRAYSSNAKIIQTVDEMLQETTNLKR